MTLSPHVRGRALIARRDFVLERRGPDVWARVLSGLGDETRRQLDAATPDGWYDLEIYDRLQQKIAAQLGGVADELYAEMGAFSAACNALPMFGERTGDPFQFFRHIAVLHRQLFDFGETTVVRRPGGCLIEVDFEGAARASICKSGTGFYRQCAEMSGGRKVHVDLAECQSRGDPSCLFKVSWRRLRMTITSPPRNRPH
jgi:hypothetical protein